MRITYTEDRERVFIFASEEERRKYFDEQEITEQNRHSSAIRQIHADYISELKAENSYSEGTLKMLGKLKLLSKLEGQETP